MRIGASTAGDDTAREARGLFNEESVKTFRGEPYERVMAYYYRGILYWMDGEPDNARAAFRSAAVQDQNPELGITQADWVLVYSARVSTSPEARWLLRDRVEGQCLVECALLDTRSGLIPFTARSVEEIHVQERSGEDLPVLQLRAEQEAIDAAMLQNARALVAFLTEPSRP